MIASLFITCIVDQVFPDVGIAVAETLGKLGVDVVFNSAQTCCGQPAFNTGYRQEAREIATHFLDVFEKELETADYLVAPSGSCTAMVKRFYSELFADDPDSLAKVERVSARLYEYSEFLVKVLGRQDLGAQFEGRVTYHDSCHLRRELGIFTEPRSLISNTRGAELVEMDKADVCCGFGGTFSVKFPEISVAIGEEKISSIERSGADTVVACDSSCLMQISGLLQKRGSAVRCMHIAQLLNQNS